MAQSQHDHQKITLTLPKALIQRLRQEIPTRQRAEFVAHALEESLALAEQSAVLAETAGAWKDANHPEMQTPDDIDQWLNNLRGTWPDRLAHLQGHGS